MSILLIISCLAACNSDRFRPKSADLPIDSKEVVPQAESNSTSLTIAQEVEQEQIGDAQLNYSDLDESGNGIYGRKISDSFNDKLRLLKEKADPSLKGTVSVICCINRAGAVMMNRPDVANTTMNDLPLQRKLGKILIDERFEANASAPERQCGVVKVEF